MYLVVAVVLALMIVVLAHYGVDEGGTIDSADV